MTVLGQWHDESSRWLFRLAGAALLLAVALYAFEVIARYLFDMPTTWSGEAVQYSLAILIFCALPDVTRRSAHVAIDIVPESLPENARRILARINALVAALATGLAAWIVAGESLRQFEKGLMTNAANPIPRWWITAFIALGLASAALHFLRHMIGRRG
ncbi:TRAP transporter small permease [Sulfitobacter aestuariivivens]|uniref:TRAP transporter small permease protein n=1 Tax=Sulfitobacter aestuariivivens TaxID=2766981 RepID=A0A927D8W5_9RHOB|nr:TRAP transporter small permease [Sulfitobacter aestuariivivens]MBD3666283.1 TRAP transporter small permease [Sulfitobacter aestuariivivens]